MHTKRSTYALLAVISFLLGSAHAIWAVGERAVAPLRDAEGKVLGVALFVQEPQGVRISATVKGLSPGEHGIHIHAVGKCEPPDFLSAGLHFNPANKQHGLNNPEGPHAGDLPNLVANEDGSALYEHVTDHVTLGPGELSLFDADSSALVIHAGPDDQMTDPSGNSGARVLCGIISPMKTASIKLPHGAIAVLVVGIIGLLVWFLFLRR